MEFTFVEITGYLASLGVLVSFLMKDIRKLRIINTIGCLFFIWYGILLHYAVPVIVTNVVIVIVNCYYLLKQK